MEYTALRDRLCPIISYGYPHVHAEDNADVERTAASVLAALGLDDLDAAVGRALKGYHDEASPHSRMIWPHEMRVALEAALTATEEGD